ncbi:MAG: hypothetical protein JJU06_13125 [Ectothiorhodospiraceae bacterium]|nr:hypothetical protein [Ectothiorhodospiraceae bacterium]
MSENGSVWKQIAAGVISGVILLALSWLGGVLPTIWAWLLAAANLVWSTLTYAVTIPVWLAIVVIVAMGWIAAYVFRKPPALPAESPAEPLPQAHAELALNPLETQIVRSLAHADGGWLTLDDLAEISGSPRLLVEQSVERLHSMDLLLDRLNAIHGQSFRLSSTGRDIAISRGYVPQMHRD